MSRSLPLNFTEGLPGNEASVDHSRGELDETQVWLDFIRGSDHAIGSIYRSYVNKLYNYGKQFTRNEELVLDAVQDVFLGLIKNRQKLGVAISVKFYLYASLRRNLLRQIKRNRKIVFKDDFLDEESFKVSIESSPLSLNQLYSSDQRKVIEHACNSLPPNQREALILHYLEEFSYKEISEIMKISTVKSVRGMVYRALDALSKSLAGCRDKV